MGANKLECYFCALNARESAQRQNLCNKRVPTTSRSIRFFVFNAKLLALRNRSPKHPSPCHRRRLPNVSDSGDTPTPTKAPTPAPYTGESRGRSDMAYILFGCLRCDQLRHPWTRSGQKHDRCQPKWFPDQIHVVVVLSARCLPLHTVFAFGRKWVRGARGCFCRALKHPLVTAVACRMMLSQVIPPLRPKRLRRRPTLVSLGRIIFSPCVSLARQAPIFQYFVAIYAQSEAVRANRIYINILKYYVDLWHNRAPVGYERSVYVSC